MKDRLCDESLTNFQFYVYATACHNLIIKLIPSVWTLFVNLDSGAYIEYYNDHSDERLHINGDIFKNYKGK